MNAAKSPQQSSRKVPSLSCHKASGRAYVRLNGRCIYLGTFGSLEAIQKYHRVIAQWIAFGRTLKDQAGELTVLELVDMYRLHVEEYYVKPDGTPAVEQQHFRHVLRMMNDLYGTTAAAMQALAGCLKKLRLLRDKDEVALRKLQEKFKEEKAKSVERMRLERQRNELNAQRRIQRDVAEKLKKLWAQREALLQELSQLADQRTLVRQAVVDRINESLGPAIRVSLRHNGDSSLYQQLLAECLVDSRMRYTGVAEKLSQAFAPAELAKLLRQRDRDRLVEEGGINAEQAEKTVAKLADCERLFELEAVELVDLPKIELLDGETYKNSLSLSSGQKCTAILPILMLDSKNPLLIDQPEDNLDNSFVYETIVSTIHKMKGRRQMVFVTHNPNIPVLGDAEMLFLMRSNGVHGKIVAHGSLEELKAQVMALEGGPAAFEARMARYGY